MVTMNDKAEAAAAIERAKNELDGALERLSTLPAVDAGRLTYAAHALGNYLMVVSTTVHLLRNALKASSDNDVCDRLSALTHATKLMKHLVRQLLAGEGADKPNLLLMPFDLTTVVKWASDEYQPIGAEKGIQIVRDISPTPITIWADRVALGAILDNLFSNAVKYSAEGGIVTVSVYEMNGSGVTSIADSGPGIKESELSQLFTRGGRLSNLPTGGEHSTGYGLAIAKDLVDALDGRIWVENNLRGATFSFSVPLYDSQKHLASVM